MPSSLGAQALTRRIFRQWVVTAKMGLIWITRDLASSLVYLASDTLTSVSRVAATFLLAERFGGIGAWSKPQLVFMLGYAMLVDAFVLTFFSYNVAHISRRIGRGQLDHILIQPQPIWTALLTEGFTPFESLTLLIPAIAVLSWAGQGHGFEATPMRLAILVLSVVASSLIVVSCSFIWGSLAFWAPRGAEEISSPTLRLIDSLKPFPLDGVGPSLRMGLLTLIPSGFAAWMPARALVGLDLRPASLLFTPLAAVLFALVAFLVFRAGLAHYARTGSQRYVSSGHRS